MHDQEALQMMARCSSEIKQLRAKIERLAPKAQAYDDLHALIRFLPQGYGISSTEDLAYVLDKRISELTEAAKSSPAAAE
jgi:hypothetical protein